MGCRWVRWVTSTEKGVHLAFKICDRPCIDRHFDLSWYVYPVSSTYLITDSVRSNPSFKMSPTILSTGEGGRTIGSVSSRTGARKKLKKQGRMEKED